MEYNAFDHILRKKLQQLDPPYEPSSWEHLEQRLKSLGLTRDPQDLSEIVAYKLRQLEEERHFNADWDTFAQMLAHDEADATTRFDDLTRQKLKGYRPKVPSDWPRMHYLIEQHLTIHGRLHRYGVPQIILVLLLIFTLFPYVKLWMPNVSWDLNPTELAATKAIPQPQIVAIQPLRKEGPSLPSTTVTTATACVHRSKTAALFPPAIPTSFPSIETPTPHTHQPKKLMQRISQEPPSFTPSPSTDEVIASLETAMASLRTESGHPDSAPSVEMHSIRRFYIDMLTTTDVNLVISPYDPVFGIPSDTTIAVGFGVGMSLAWQHNRWEWATGLIYNIKRYTPNTPKQILGSLGYLIEENFTGIQLDIVQLPVSIRHQLGWHPRWRTYISAGASAHLVLSPFYDIRHREIAPLLALVPDSEKDPEKILSQSRLREKDFPVGLLRGGSLRNNSWWTLNMGLGVERQITDRLSIATQSIFTYDVKKLGFGPNADRVHTLSLLMGLRWRMD